MKRIKNWVAAAVFAASALCLSASAYADNCCDPCTEYSGSCGECRFNLTADILFLNACQELPYLLQGSEPSFTLVGSEYDWDVGFRLNGHYQSDCSGWDANLSFTWFSSDVEETAASGAGHVFARINENAPSAFEAVAGEYTFRNDLDYWHVDALIGHTCCVCPGFTVRPYGGFKGVSVEQDSAQTWTNFSVSHSVEFSGYGLTGGVETKCVPCNCFCNDLSIWGKVGGSVVGGDLDHTIFYQKTGENGQETTTVLGGKCHTSFGYEIGLGLAYDHCFCDKWWSFGVGYEITHWTDVGNPIVAADDSLTLHGVTLRGSVTF